MICVDNSEWMRNGDYPPSRFQAQADAVNLICGAKTQSNPENTVGVLTMAGKGVRVLVTPTADLGKILSSMHGVEVAGETNLVSGVQVAQLALKHRQNKNQRQRIVLFAGSPVESDAETLVRIGKKLKKNNVALDVVSFGDEDETKSAKLESLLGAVNSNDNSHLVHVPPGPAILSDVLLSSPIFTGDGEGGSGFAAAAAAGAAAAAAAGGATGGFDFGVDPNLDPELALALRVSMEEERARQEAAAKRAAEETAGGASSRQGENTTTTETVMGEADASGTAREVDMTEAGGAHGQTASDSVPGAATGGEVKGGDPMEDETALLRQALAMSMGDTSEGGNSVAVGDSTMGESIGDDSELALALQMSMQQAEIAAMGESRDLDLGNVLGDASFVTSVLASLPGVNPDDPSVRDVLASLANPTPSKDSKEDGGEKEEKP